MNFTYEFINMVSISDEIQKCCKYEMGNWFIDEGEKPYVLLYEPNEFETRATFKILPTKDIDYIKGFNNKWLPTLEDLLGMLQGSCCLDKIDDFYHWLVVFPYTGEKYIFTDLKIYLLIYVMKVNYKKRWNGKYWEPIK